VKTHKHNCMSRPLPPLHVTYYQCTVHIQNFINNQHIQGADSTQTINYYNFNTLVDGIRHLEQQHRAPSYKYWINLTGYHAMYRLNYARYQHEASRNTPPIRMIVMQALRYTIPRRPGIQREE